MRAEHLRTQAIFVKRLIDANSGNLKKTEANVALGNAGKLRIDSWSGLTEK